MQEDFKVQMKKFRISQTSLDSRYKITAENRYQTNIRGPNEYHVLKIPN